MRKLFRRPGWAGMSEHPELCVSILQWLRDHRLELLARAFELPVTAFGYGNLDEIPAPYALRYGTGCGLIAFLLSAAPFARWLPKCLLLKRFRHGFQRLWERLAWELNVRLNVQVTSIQRLADRIVVTYQHPVQLLNQQVTHAEDRAEFDYLIIACPLVEKDLERIMPLTEEEADSQSHLRFIPYAVASFEISHVVLQERMTFHLPLPETGAPMLVYQPHPDNELMVFYARLASSQPTSDDESRLREHIERYVRAFGGQINIEDDWHSYDAWLYFKHVSADDMRDGYYDRWERIQGENRTFYVGGLFDFDYVEGVARNSRAVIERHFLDKARRW
jgi:hypothetical protein